MDSQGGRVCAPTNLINLDSNDCTNHEVIVNANSKLKSENCSNGEEIKFKKIMQVINAENKESNANEWDVENDDQKLINESIPHYYAWTGASGIVLALLNSCFIFCVLPQHNIFTEPSFWYEFMTVSVFGFIGLFAGCFVLNCSIWMNLESIKTWKNFICLYFISAIAWVTVNVTYYILWVLILELRPPMPLNLHVCGIFTLVVVMFSFWFLFPIHIRSSRTFWKRYLYYFLAQIFRNACVWEYFFLAKLFLIIDPNYQWTLAILLQLVREFNCTVLTKVCYKAASCENNAIRITCLHEMGCRHAVFLCVALALLATTTTSFLCLGFDFGINFLLCIKIIWDKRKHKHVLTTKDNPNLQELALNEKVVYIVPLTYCICFLLAYYGPNARIIGNVKNTSWHYGMVEDISIPIYMMGLLFFIDFVSIIMWTLLLKKFSNISYIDGYMYIQKEVWLVMAIQEAYALNEVRQKYITRIYFFF